MKIYVVMKEGDDIPFDTFTTEDVALQCFDYLISTESPYPGKQFWIETRIVKETFDAGMYK